MSDIGFDGLARLLALLAAILILLASGLVVALRRAVVTPAARLPVAVYALFAAGTAAQPFLDAGEPEAEALRFWLCAAAAGLAWVAIALRIGRRAWLRDTLAAFLGALAGLALAAVAFALAFD